MAKKYLVECSVMVYYTYEIEIPEDMGMELSDYIQDNLKLLDEDGSVINYFDETLVDDFSEIK